jgi:hydroxypyruvate reductase
VVTLALSDVVGDPLDVIASGPTAPDPTTYADALRVLTRHGVLEAVPRAVRDHLDAGARGERGETPKPGDPVWERVENVIIGNNALIAEAAVNEAKRLGFRTELMTRHLQGEAREVGRDLVRRARLAQPPACLIAAGETTVTVRGRGRGGRCQELALAAALEIGLNEPLTLLAAGTDGTDGPTDAAGAVVDARTAHGDDGALNRARAALDDNDSYAFLSASDDLIVSGPTNTNLLDLYIALHISASETG